MFRAHAWAKSAVGLAMGARTSWHGTHQSISRAVLLMAAWKEEAIFGGLLATQLTQRGTVGKAADAERHS